VKCLVLGAAELLFIVVLALVLFGPQKLPEIARFLGKAYKEAQKVCSDFLKYIYGGEEVEAKPKPKIEHVKEAREVLQIARMLNVIRDDVNKGNPYETLYKLLKGLKEKQ